MPLSLLRATIVFLSITLLVSPNTAYSSTEENVFLASNELHQSLADNDKGEILFQDDFTQPPLGFNSSLWNLTTFGHPNITWEDNEILETRFGPFDSACLESSLMFNPDVIAEVNFSASQGLGYFSIGWCDNWINPEEEWVFNSRLCTNGVFLDCWDGEVYLATFRDGERSVAPLKEQNLKQTRTLTLVWTESLVQLYVDGELSAYISESIPASEMPLHLCASGHHYRTEEDEVRYHFLRIFERQRQPHTEDPVISLLWPSNGSDVLPTDIIDFEVQGVLGPFQYSWDSSSYRDISSPWDVPVPSVEGHHKLSVRASNVISEWKYMELEFYVIEHQTTLDAYTMDTEPIIDGVLSPEEKDQLGFMPLRFRNEHRDSIEVLIVVGFSGESLYIAIESPLEDSFHSRTCLLLDGDGDDRWNTTQSDLAVTVASPSAYQGYTGLSSPHSSQPDFHAFEGLVFQSAAEEGPVVSEFLIPLNRLVTNETSGTGIGFRIVNGGQKLEYPYDALEGNVPLLHILNAGVNPAITQRNISLWMVFLITSSVIGIAAYLSKKEEFSVVHELTDEQFERVKLLLFSHQRIPMQRIARMIGTDAERAEEIVVDLLARGFPAFVDGEDVIRTLKTTKKKEKGVSSSTM